MSYAFCTIITRSHLHWALALHDSIRAFLPDAAMKVLVTDTDDVPASALANSPGVEVLRMADIMDVEPGPAIATTYRDQPDELRWSLKPILMLHLLKTHERVLFCDCDLRFFHSPAFLLDALQDAGMLLSPHWRSSRASADLSNFIKLSVEGLYNGGLVGASRKGLDALRNWADNCAVLCVKDPKRGQFVDQGHLTLLPVYFPEVKVIRHRGCNVAGWNRVECRRSPGPNGEVLINDKEPVVFIHFTEATMRGIVRGFDPLLMPYLEQFRDGLARHKPGDDIIAKVRKRFQERLHRNRYRRFWRNFKRRLTGLLPGASTKRS